MQDNNSDLIQDYKAQIVMGENEIVENEKMLAQIEPGFWMRTITGYLFFAVEILLYLIVILLICGTIWINANWLSFTMKIYGSMSANVSMHSTDLDFVLYVLMGFFLFVAIITLFLALLMRSSRRNLFKLATVAQYLDKTLIDRKMRRDKVFEMLVNLEK